MRYLYQYKFEYKLAVALRRKSIRIPATRFLTTGSRLMLYM